MPKVVVIGGSYAGHLALRIFHAASNTVESVLVSPADETFYNVAAPRLFVEPGQWDRTVSLVKANVAKIAGSKGGYLKGRATSVDFDAQTVTVATVEGEQTLDYDYLVIASGVASKYAAFKVNLDGNEARKAIEDVHAKLPTIKSLAVIGGGPTGVETVGEIAHDYPDIKVTLYTGAAGPLATVPKLVKGATDKLAALGVEIVNDVRVTRQGDLLTLPSGEIRDFDLVLDAYLTHPYTDFLPADVKSAAGYVLTDKHLVVKGHPNVFALGDVVDGSAQTLVDLKFGQTGPFTASVRSALTGGSANKLYTPQKNIIVVPVSRTGGVGILFGFGAPNWLVRFVKSKTFMIESAQKELT